MNTKVISFSIILIIVVAVSSWIAVNVARSMLKPTSISTNESDFFMTNVEYTQMDENGMMRNQIYTNKMEHYPKDDHYTFNAPHIEMIDKDNNPWKIEAKQGTSEKNGTVINLWDDVKIARLANSSGRAGMTVTTSAVTIHPQEKFAKTDKPVVIKQGGSMVNSVGAEINFKNSTVKLLSKVQGKYEAVNQKTADRR